MDAFVSFTSTPPLPAQFWCQSLSPATVTAPVPVDVFWEAFDPVSAHIEPLQCRQIENGFWDGGEVVHGEIQMVQFS